MSDVNKNKNEEIIKTYKKLLDALEKIGPWA